MGEPKVKNMVHEMRIWKDAVDSELKMAAEWDANWGFLKASKPSSQMKSMTKSASSPSLVQAGQGVLKKSSSGQQDPGGDRIAVLARRGYAPKEKFARPITTAHEIGWRPSLELFGGSNHGIRRNPELWPERGAM
eukprot:gnl/MRDRNA2_/MRDRNA2_84430_c0_seq1.p1 gnl/MRDRNA2_/MRDRNA2_84430_c0~~gnl/MRDRNA2_/MRDRNA2_84430_c0_seq1.p1  ORF type:complete len:135 (+),score=29.84 gnl/MRDRNA2_/MRDRNA2_84430_c0_seq1:96-500(+)